MCLQVVCNANYVAYAIPAIGVGSMHDSTLLLSSPFMQELASRIPAPYCLIGDSGYALSEKLQVPFRQASIDAIGNWIMKSMMGVYNTMLCTLRVVIEQFNGIWKMRFRAMALGLNFQTPEKCLLAIRTSIILHNICRIWKVSENWSSNADNAATRLAIGYEAMTSEAMETPGNENRADHESTQKFGSTNYALLLPDAMRELDEAGLTLNDSKAAGHAGKIARQAMFKVHAGMRLSRRRRYSTAGQNSSLLQE